MAIVVAGLNHKSADRALRERFASLAPEDIYEKARRGNLKDVVILSTCNRFEAYACGLDRQADAPASVLGFLESLLAAGPVQDALYRYSGLSAIEHLFCVASGLDSLIVGESEILGQVKGAYERARAAGLTGKIGNVLFQRALYVGKRVRGETGISVGQTSVASVAVELAQSIFGDLAESSVLILGAGQTAELAARHFLAKKVLKLSISNRTRGRAEILAESLGGAEVVAWEGRAEAILKADIVLTSTGSPRPVVTAEMISRGLKNRSGRSLFIVDLAMPRDVGEGVHDLDHVYVYTLEDLERVAAGNLAGRNGEIARARSIVENKAAEFHAWTLALESGNEKSLKHSDEPRKPREVSAAEPSN